MVKIILIKKNGDIQEKNVKSLEDDTLLYKKCGFQTAKDFGLQHMYKAPRQYKQFDYAVYAKTSDTYPAPTLFFSKEFIIAPIISVASFGFISSALAKFRVDCNDFII